MVATDTRPAAAQVDTKYSPTAEQDVRRTLLALLASAMGVVPLCDLISDSGWLIDVWLTMVVVIGPAALLRTRRPPSAGQIWIGLVLLVPWLTLRFLGDHALLGIIPLRASWHDLGHLMADLRHTTTVEAAPVHSTVAIKLALCALLGLVAALVDLVAVVGRRGALAGVPLLVVFTVSGAVPREPVTWYLFAISAAGFLILLALDSSDDLHRWGHFVPRANPLRSRTAETGQRIGVAAIALAIVVPVFVPANSGNLLADLFHNAGGSGLDTGIGRGTGGGTGGIDPFVALRGQLNKKEPVNLFDVTVTSGDGTPVGPSASTQLFYARSNVLSDSTGTGWKEGAQGSLESLDGSRFASVPGTGFTPNSEPFTVQVKDTNLSSSPPLFARPTAVSGLDSSTQWSPQDQLLENSRIHPGDTYEMSVQQPSPTRQALEAAVGHNPDLDPWLKLAPVTNYVRSLVGRLTAAAVTPYARTMAIYNYFTNPANGFSYSLATATANTGDELTDFLLKKLGYCQQYAAAMGVMLRVAGVPARVVLGYAHAVPDSRGTFTVTTNDAHAWVEAYFDGIGWVPFDPTPLDGITGGAHNDLAWAPHQQTADTGNSAAPTSGVATSGPRSPAPSSSAAPRAAGADTGNGVPGGALIATGVLVVVLLIVFTPWAVRQRRRSYRLRQARHGDTDALWAELSDTATDLGYVWSAARTPRQVAAWLSGPSGPAAAQLRDMASTVEQVRYAPAQQTTDSRQLVDDLAAVRAGLSSGRPWAERTRSALFPASLGWPGPLGFLRSVGRRARRH